MSSHFLSFNSVHLVGRITRDPELKDVKDKRAHLVRFSVATQEIFRNTKTNKDEVRPEFHLVVGWGKKAVFVGTKLEKGRLVIVDGVLRHRYFTDENGHKRKLSQVEIVNIIPLPKGAVMDPKEKEPEGDPF